MALCVGRDGAICPLAARNERLDWQGAQIPLIGFDELTHFGRAQFFYLLTGYRFPACAPMCGQLATPFLMMTR